jgi:hypothetical protein
MESTSKVTRLPLESHFRVFASRRPAMGACRVRGDRGVFDRAGRRLAKTSERCFVDTNFLET